MDIANPAIAKHFDIPPALVEAIHDDPAAFAPAARVMALQTIHEMYVDRDVLTPTQKKDFAELLLKAGKIDGRGQEVSGAGQERFHITFNIPSAPGQQSASISMAAEPEAPALEVEFSKVREGADDGA